MGIIVAGVFAVIAGLGEVVVGFTGNYLGILSHSIRPSFATGLTGPFFHSLGGLMAFALIVYIASRWRTFQ